MNTTVISVVVDQAEKYIENAEEKLGVCLNPGMDWDKQQEIVDEVYFNTGRAWGLLNRLSVNGDEMRRVQKLKTRCESLRRRARFSIFGEEVWNVYISPRFTKEIAEQMSWEGVQIVDADEKMRSLSGRMLPKHFGYALLNLIEDIPIVWGTYQGCAAFMRACIFRQHILAYEKSRESEEKKRVAREEAEESRQRQLVEKEVLGKLLEAELMVEEGTRFMEGPSDLLAECGATIRTFGLGHLTEELNKVCQLALGVQ
jgi:hypothetical protein